MDINTFKVNNYYNSASDEELFKDNTTTWKGDFDKYLKKINKKAKEHIKDNTLSEKDNYTFKALSVCDDILDNRYIITCCGHASNGKFIKLFITGIKPVLDIAVTDIKFKENLRKILKKKKVKKTYEAKHIRVGSKVQTWHTLEFNNLKERSYFIREVKEDMAFDISNDSTTDYFNVFQKLEMITLGTWITIKGLELYDKDKSIYTINYKEIKTISDDDLLKIRLTTPILTFDTETYTDKTYAEKYEKEALKYKLPIPCFKSTKISYISWTFSFNDKILTAGAFTNIGLVESETVSIAKTIPNEECPELDVIICKDEKSMLINFLKLFTTFKPNIVCGFNDSGYDWPLVLGKFYEYKLLEPMLLTFTSYNNYEVSSEDLRKFDTLERETKKLYNRQNTIEKEEEEEEEENEKKAKKEEEEEIEEEEEDEESEDEEEEEVKEVEEKINYSKIKFAVTRKLEATNNSNQIYPAWGCNFVPLDIRFTLLKRHNKEPTSLNYYLKRYKIGKKADISHTIAQYYSEVINNQIKNNGKVDLDKIKIESRFHEELDDLGIKKDIRSLLNQMTAYSIMDSVLTLKLLLQAAVESSISMLAYFSNISFESAYGRGTSYIVLNACGVIAEKLPLPIKFDNKRPNVNKLMIKIKDLDATEYHLYLKELHKNKDLKYLKDLRDYHELEIEADYGKYPGAYVFDPYLEPITPNKNFEEKHQEYLDNKDKKSVDIKYKKFGKTYEVLNSFNYKFENKFSPKFPELLVYIKILGGKFNDDIKFRLNYLRSFKTKVKRYIEHLTIYEIFNNERDMLLKKDKKEEIRKMKEWANNNYETKELEMYKEVIGKIADLTNGKIKFNYELFKTLYCVHVYVDSEIQKSVYEHSEYISFKKKKSNESINPFALLELIERTESIITIDKDIFSKFMDLKRYYINLEGIANFSTSQLDFIFKPFSTPVISYDFASLYPTIITTWNMSPELMEISTNDEEKRQEFSKNTKYNTLEYLMGRKDCPNSSHYLDHKGDRTNYGLYPEVVSQLFDKRVSLKAKLAATDKLITALEAEGESKELDEATLTYGVLDAQQLAVKVLMNTIYGITGSKTSSARSIDLSGSITRMGIVHIKKSRDLCAAAGCSVKYGDTDSLYLCLPETYYINTLLKHVKGELTVNEFADELVNETLIKKNALTSRINENLIRLTRYKTMRMAYEKITFPMYFMSKKKYFGNQHEFKLNSMSNPEKIYAKGMEHIKRSANSLTIEMAEKLLNKLCTVSPKSKNVEDYVMDLLYDMKEKLNSRDILKMVKTSVNVTSFDLDAVKAVKANVGDKFQINLNDTLELVIVTPPLEKIIGKKSIKISGIPVKGRKYPLQYILDKGLTTDKIYYLTKLSKSLSPYFSHLVFNHVYRSYSGNDKFTIAAFYSNVSKTSLLVVNNIVNQIADIPYTKEQIQEERDKKVASEKKFIAENNENIHGILISDIITKFGVNITKCLTPNGFADITAKNTKKPEYTAPSILLPKNVKKNVEQEEKNRIKNNLYYIINFVVNGIYKSKELEIKSEIDLYEFVVDKFFAPKTKSKSKIFNYINTINESTKLFKKLGDNLKDNNYNLEEGNIVFLIEILKNLYTDLIDLFLDNDLITKKMIFNK